MFSMSNKVYDIVKWVLGIVLPALAVLYGSLSETFGLPYSEEVPATLMAIVMFGSALLQTQVLKYAKMNQAAPMPSDQLPHYPFKMSGPVYDTLKWLIQVGLPAVSVGYLALADIWQLTWALEVNAIVAALVAFGSAVLQVSATGYRRAVVENWQRGS